MPTVPECNKHYLELNVACEKVINESFSSQAATLHCKSHNFSKDMENWILFLDGRPEVDVLKAGLKEYQFALLAVAQGQYRQSFMALRLFFELALASISFSANEFNLRMWLQGSQDIVWQTLINADTGVLSKNFLRAFNPASSEHATQFRTLAEKVYRECSEYVHGNAHTHESLPEHIVFVDTIFADWHLKAENIALCINFAFSARYLYLTKKENRTSIERTVVDSIGHLDYIRALFSE